jgi:hypothetical protein
MNEIIICEICKKVMRRVNQTHLNSHGIKFKDYVSKYPNSKTISDEVAKSTTISLENFIKKYGDEIGLERWESYKAKQAYSNTFEYKHKRYGWSREKFDAYNKSRSVTKDNLIKKNGKDIGLIKWNSYVERQKYAGCALDYFIEKYGEVKGLETFNKLNESKKLNRNTFIRKYGEHIGEIKFNEWISKISKRPYFSKISQTLFESIEDKNSNYIFYASNRNGEFFVFDKEEEKINFFDYVDMKRKKCIEFNGDIFHANPILFKENAKPNPYMKDLTASEIWLKDSKKIKLIQDHGYDTMIVWEYDYTRKPNEIIKNCLNFLYD